MKKGDWIYVVVIFAIVLGWFFLYRKTTLTDLSDEQRKAIAQTVKGKKWFPFLLKTANDYNLPGKRIASIVCVESQGNENAVGTSGERGLMQLMEQAVKDVYDQWGSSYFMATMTGLSLFDAEKNISIGTTYLGILKMRTGNLDEATKQYNGRHDDKYLNEVKSYEKYF